MKIRLTLLLATCTLLMSSCDAFKTLSDSKRYASQGSPYEVVTICNQPIWEGPVGDSLRVILRQQDPYINAKEVMFDLFQVTPQNVTKIVDDHRNQIEVKVDPTLTAAEAGVRYDVTASPQIIITLQGPTEESIADYLGTHRESLMHLLEKSERDRAIAYARVHGEPFIEEQIAKQFAIQMDVPKGYLLAKQTDDFMWVRYEYPQASKGFMLYKRPFEGKMSLSEGELLAARLKFAAEIPGPSEGSYMTTSPVFPPIYRLVEIEGRVWAEMRGFWDVENDFMGGPFVSYTTLNEATGEVITLDGYIYSPKLNKRNFLRDVEHLVYLIHFEEPTPEQK